MFRKEFDAALLEAEEINYNNFRGRLVGNGGALLNETKDFLQFRFTFEKDDTDLVSDINPKSQSEIIDTKGVKLFTGILNARYKKEGTGHFIVDVFVVNTHTYDKVSYDREEMLRRLRR